MPLESQGRAGAGFGCCNTSHLLPGPHQQGCLCHLPPAPPAPPSPRCRSWIRFHRRCCFASHIMPWLVGALRLGILQRLFANAGHAANDLRVLNNPQSLLGSILWGLKILATWYFRLYCSCIQSLQLQSSKVSVISRHCIVNGTTASLLFVDRIIGILMK